MVLLLLIGGCAGSWGTIRSNPPPPPVTSFDGSYRNTIQTTHAFGGQNWCDSPGQPIITVENGQFTYAVPHPNLPSGLSRAYSATFAQDGSFNGEDVIGTLSGRVDGAHIVGKIDGSGCGYAFAGDRI